MPLGTANDFATACGIPSDPLQALQLAQVGEAREVDAAQANDYHFINVASGGFGAQVTANTPVALKNFLGGGAYTLSGLIQAVNFAPYRGEVRIPGEILQSQGEPHAQHDDAKAERDPQPGEPGKQRWMPQGESAADNNPDGKAAGDEISHWIVG